LLALLAEHREHYAARPEDAAQLLAVGTWHAPRDLDPGTLAAWTSVARVILNLHETMTRY
jgi:hypothetical protein